MKRRDAQRLDPEGESPVRQDAPKPSRVHPFAYREEVKMATFYVTKYALTGGIRKVEGEAEKSSYDDRLIVRDGYNWLVIGRDVFATEPEALADAEKRRIAKIASLRKQIAKLENLTFTTPDTGRK